MDWSVGWLMIEGVDHLKPRYVLCAECPVLPTLRYEAGFVGAGFPRMPKSRPTAGGYTARREGCERVRYSELTFDLTVQRESRVRGARALAVVSLQKLTVESLTTNQAIEFKREPDAAQMNAVQLSISRPV